MRDGIRMIRDVVRQPSLAPFVDGEIAPGPGGPPMPTSRLMSVRRWARCTTRSGHA